MYRDTLYRFAVQRVHWTPPTSTGQVGSAFAGIHLAKPIAEAYPAKRPTWTDLYSVMTIVPGTGWVAEEVP